MPVAKNSDRAGRSATKGDKSSGSAPARNINGNNSRSAANAERGANGERFEGPRSPPNTAHVPCKFFRQGACQAGNACPFSHDIGAAAENVCKYFAKGNCKFGPKCANIHVLPDGRRVNYGKHGLTLGGPALAIGRQHHNPGAFTQGAASSALSYGLRGDFEGSEYDFNDMSAAATPTLTAQQPASVGGDFNMSIPSIDVPFSAEVFGSPRDEISSSFRLGMGLSPLKAFSALDTPLPASFDSTGFSNVALYPAAPWPSSVPSKFGMESPMPSLASPVTGLSGLGSTNASGFGAIGSDYLSSSHAVASGSNMPAVGEEQFGRRMHSATSRFAKPKLLSASVPKSGLVDHDWDNEFGFVEEDYVPQNLQELLTPAEKARRGSSRVGDLDEPSALSNSLKYGSPILSGSPSRWGPMFPRKDEELSSSMHKVSAFGVVGSPLRTSSLASEMHGRPVGGGLGGLATSFGAPGSYGTPSGSYGGGGSGFSMLSAQLRQTHLDSNNNNPVRMSASPLGGGFASLHVPTTSSGLAFCSLVAAW